MTQSHAFAHTVGSRLHSKYKEVAKEIALWPGAQAWDPKDLGSIPDCYSLGQITFAESASCSPCVHEGQGYQPPA